MSRQSIMRRGVLMGAGMVVAFSAMTIYGAELGQEAARLDCFSHPDGTNYFALSLKPAVAAPVAEPRDVVILVCTSAGEVGGFRDLSLEALRRRLPAWAPKTACA